ncbi:MAG: DUF2065 family protein [Burkholderiaceae bacterium]
MVSFELILTALGLVLVLEGLLPFLGPSTWREVFLQVAKMTDGQIRFMGLGALLLGLFLILI